MELLKGQKILLGITGGIAAYKTPSLIRLIKKMGGEVRVIVTENGLNFVSKVVLEELSGHPVAVSTFPEKKESYHIAFKDFADLFLITPASYNMIGKIASGIADDLLSTTAALLLGKKIPFLIFPAMNNYMFESPVLQNNLSILSKLNIKVVQPDSGWLACNEEGKGRMPEPEDIADYVVKYTHPQLYENKKVLVTAGPTREFIDPMRFISNTSSGNRGYCFAKWFSMFGGKVTLISGPTLLKPSCIIDKVINVTSADEMFEKVHSELDTFDYYISVAAIADYKPLSYNPAKIKKESSTDLDLKLVRTQDLLSSVGRKKAERNLKLVIVGFSAETENLVENSLKKLRNKGLDFIIANSLYKDEYDKVFILNDKDQIIVKGDNDHIASYFVKFLNKNR